MKDTRVAVVITRAPVGCIQDNLDRVAHWTTNISVEIDYEGTLIDMSFEIAINDEFDIYINGNHSGHYAASPSDTIPAIYDPSYETYFSEGTNLIEFIGEVNSSFPWLYRGWAFLFFNSYRKQCIADWHGRFFYSIFDILMSLIFMLLECWLTYFVWNMIF